MNEVITSPLKAIRAHCLDCCYDSAAEVKLCPVEECRLHPFRFGKNPFRAKRAYTDEERAVMSERLRAARAKSPANDAEKMSDH